MKKVWIASILATLMLMVPITNVVGASDTVEDCNCKPVSDLQVVRIERLLTRLESRINFILLKYGHIPEIAEKCEEVLDIINSDGFLEKFCDFLISLVEFVLAMFEILPYELWLLLFCFPTFIIISFWTFFCFP